ncbi:hypothetical protein GCM10009001_08540 [Virgibacillus siamensis]|uniref:Nudix hydrolase domain-containing protein n=1 Tax=Virgibacillus siamensis TaxID=480071 RepID=A0ABP3QUX7_9BACI
MPGYGAAVNFITVVSRGRQEEKESPIACMFREIKEEPDIVTSEVQFKGNVCWEVKKV